MESRRSSRLRLAVNDSGKQRLSRFIKRNLDLIESAGCIKRANTIKNCSRKNQNETTSLERVNSCTRRANSAEPLKRSASSSKTSGPTKRKSASLKKSDMPSNKTELKWVSSESGEPLKNADEPPRKPAAIPPPDEKPDPSTRHRRRLASVASSRNKAETSKKSVLFKRNALNFAGKFKQKAGKPDMSSRKSDLTMKKCFTSVSSRKSNSSESSKSSPTEYNIFSKQSISPTSNMVDSSIRTSSSAEHSFVTAKTSNSSVIYAEVPTRKNNSLSANTHDTSSNKPPQANSSAGGASVSSNKSNTQADNSDVFQTEPKSCFDVVLVSNSEDLKLKSETFSRNPDVIAVKPESPATNPVGPYEESELFAKPNSPAANSVISILDSDSCSVNIVDSSQSESSDSSLSDSESRNAEPDSSASKSVDSSKYDSNALAERLESSSRSSTVPSGNPATPKKIPHVPKKSECIAPRSRPRKLSDLHSKKSYSKQTEVEEPDLCLDTLKQTMLELFTSGDSSETLPFIKRNWAEKSGSCQTKKLPNLKYRNQTDTPPSMDFLSLIDLKTNSYYVQCQLDEVERETMTYVARRWNWTRDPELSHDTKYVIVKEESFDEDFDGIPENILKANAFGGCVLLFKYVQECAAEDDLLHITERHIPNHEGTRRKMLGRYRLAPMFDGFAFFITPEISGAGRHERDFALLRNLLRLTRSKLCSTLDELQKSPETNKVALRSTARSELEGVKFVHYHWLYECLLYYKVYPIQPYTCDFTVFR